MKILNQIFLVMVAIACIVSTTWAQPPGGQGRGGQRQGPPGGPNGNDPGRAVLQALDSDGNHEISAKEIANAVTALKKLDTNGDGKLSDADLQQGQRGNERGRGNRPEGAKGREGRGRPQRGQGGPPHGAGGPPSPEQFVKDALNFDVDKDGKLSPAELKKFAEQIGPPPHGPGHDRVGGAREGGAPKGRKQRPDRTDR